MSEAARRGRFFAPGKVRLTLTVRVNAAQPVTPN